MSQEFSFVITFDSTHAAMDGEKQLLSTGTVVHVIPTPRQITANCGLSLKVSGMTLEALEDLIAKLKIDLKALYLMESYHKIEKIR